jgi:molecular chaperone HscB
MKKAAVVVESLFMSDERCWNCHQAIDALLCSQCGRIQPPTQKDYFTLLGLPVSYSMDLGYLEKKYLQIQQQIHPDRFVGASVREKRYAAQQSSIANQGYEVLKDPIQRGHYLLKLLDGDYREEDNQTYPDLEFLDALLSEQDTIESGTDLEQIQDIAKRGREMLQSYEDTIRQAFEEQNHKVALSYLNRYRYKQSLIDKATQKSNQLRN